MGGGKKKVDHQYRTYFKFEMKIMSSNDAQGSVGQKMGDIMVKMQERDNNFAFINIRDNEVLAYSRQQIPKELKDLKDEWMHFAGGNKSFRNNIPSGKLQRIKGTFYIATMWDPKRLVENTDLNLD